MNFLLDTDTCSLHLKDERRLTAKFAQHRGQLAISAITLGELCVWALRRSAPVRRIESLDQLVGEVIVLDTNELVAREYGRLQAACMDIGHTRPTADTFIAATAIAHDLTLVTHNTSDFSTIPGLKEIDWIG